MDYLFIKLLIVFYSVIFMMGSYYLYYSYLKMQNLYPISKKITYLVWILFFNVVVILFSIFYDLNSKGYQFATEYKVSIDSPCVSIGNDIEKDDIYLHNKNSTVHHMQLCIDNNITSVKLTSNLRKAIVDGELLSYTPNRTTGILTIQKSVKNGSYIRLGRADYKIYYDQDSITLKNIFFSFDLFNLYQMYSTTTLPDLTDKTLKSNKYISIWSVFFMIVSVLFFVALIVSAFFHKLQNYKNIGEKRYFLYPIIYFILFAVFLYFASFVNFTVMYFYQLNSFAKGSLFTEIIVAVIILLVAIVPTALYYFARYKWRLIGLFSVIFILFFLGFNMEYNEQLGWKNLVVLIAEQGFLYVIFGVLLGLLLASQNQSNKHGQTYLFILNNQINFKFFSILTILTPMLIIVMGVASSSAQVQEGTGIVVIETIKLFTLFLLIPYLFQNVIYYNTALSIKYKYLYFIVILILVSMVTYINVQEITTGVLVTAMIVLMVLSIPIFRFNFLNKRWNIGKVSYVLLLISSILALGVLLKDKGSILQILLSILLIFFFFYDTLQKHGFFIQFKKHIYVLLGLGVVLSIGFYFVVLDGNIRLAMWSNPLMQEVSPERNDFMYSYEQIARGLYLIKGSSFLPTDFINNTYIILPNIHTDFIGAFFVNTFGIIGFIALLSGLIILLLSFSNAMEYIRKNVVNEIDYFIYGLNVIFVVYMVSYFIINLTAILQIIPLTDVPLPFLTYSRGVLILYVMLLVFVLTINLFYLKYKPRGR